MPHRDESWKHAGDDGLVWHVAPYGPDSDRKREYGAYTFSGCTVEWIMSADGKTVTGYEIIPPGGRRAADVEDVVVVKGFGAPTLNNHDRAMMDAYADHVNALDRIDPARDHEKSIDEKRWERSAGLGS